jgi:hypothetical protein
MPKTFLYRLNLLEPTRNNAAKNGKQPGLLRSRLQLQNLFIIFVVVRILTHFQIQWRQRILTGFYFQTLVWRLEFFAYFEQSATSKQSWAYGFCGLPRCPLL